MSEDRPPPKCFAVSSYMRGDPEYDPGWPPLGPADPAVLDQLHADSGMALYALPFRCPGRLHHQPGAWWVVLEIDPADYAERDGVVEASRATVLYNGPVAEAGAFIRSLGFEPPQSIYELVNVGDRGTGSVGNYSAILGGFEATVTAGRGSLAYVVAGEATVQDQAVAVSKFGHVSAGLGSAAVTLRGRKAEAGLCGIAISYEQGESIAGDCGTALVQFRGHARCGRRGIAIGREGDATAGAGGTALVSSAHGGYDECAAVGPRGIAIGRSGGCTVQGGPGSALILVWGDEDRRLRISVAYVGEDGIEADTRYRLDKEGRFIKA